MPLTIKMPDGKELKFENENAYEVLRNKLDWGTYPPVSKLFPLGEKEWKKKVREVFGLLPEPDTKTLGEMRKEMCSTCLGSWGDPLNRIDTEAGVKTCACGTKAKILSRMLDTWGRMDGAMRVQHSSPLSPYLQGDLIIAGDHKVIAGHMRFLFLRNLKLDWRYVSMPEMREAARAKPFEGESSISLAPMGNDVDDDNLGDSLPTLTSVTSPSLYVLAAAPDLLVIFGDAKLLTQRKYQDNLNEVLATRSGRRQQPTWIITTTAGAPAFAEATGFPMVKLG